MLGSSAENCEVREELIARVLKNDLPILAFSPCRPELLPSVQFLFVNFSVYDHHCAT